VKADLRVDVIHAARGVYPQRALRPAGKEKTVA
jgi:hypothetical protein